MELSALTSISPVDGRYRNQTAPQEFPLSDDK